MSASGSRLLLDTHVFLWWRTNDRKLRKAARDAIATADLVFVSAASVWEVAVKTALGRLTLPRPMAAGVEESGFSRLDIGFSHAELAGNLPPHHADPFDRMLLAQARLEGLTLVTHDASLKAYGVDLLLT